MSNLINPWLVKGYVDEQDTSSAQGCFVGEDCLWEGERAAENAIRAERQRLMRIKDLKVSIAKLKSELERCSPHHHIKRKSIEKMILGLEEELQHTETNVI